MIRPGTLASALRSAVGVDEYIVTHTQVAGWRRRVDALTTQEEQTGASLEAQIFADRRQGRGRSIVQFTDGQPLSGQIREGTARALAAIGPSWRLRPPSAPARVQVSDPAWQHAPQQIVDEVLQTFIDNLPRGMRALQTELAFARADHTAILSNGFDNHYRQTLLSLRALVQVPDGRPVPIHMHARRQTDLRWAEHLRGAERRSRDYAVAEPLIDTECDLVLPAAACSARSVDDLGIWTPLGQQCSAERVRTGTARYQLGQTITRTAVRGDALSMHSDGSTEFGLQSAPFGPDGQPVRRFAIVEQGLAAGYQVDHREASLGSTNANGGVRNLQIAGGSKSVDELMTPGARPMVVADGLRKVVSDQRGRIVIHLDCANTREQGSGAGIRDRRSIGGVVSGDLYQWLEEAYYSREMHDAGGCRRPEVIRFNGVRVMP